MTITNNKIERLYNNKSCECGLVLALLNVYRTVLTVLLCWMMSVPGGTSRHFIVLLRAHAVFQL